MPATEPLFPTTIAGSLPKPAWLAAPNKLWAPWRLEGDDLATAKDDATLLAIKLQEDAGIDIVGDGEQSRQHFVHGFLEAVDGIDFAKRVEMGIRNDRYKAMCPTVVGPLRLRSRVHAREARLARAHTRNKLKFTLPGPMTIVDTIADAHYGDRVKMAFAFADLLNEEARGLAADGVDVIQFDEPAFNVYMDAAATWGIEALHRAIEGVTCKTAVHICYGYGIAANIEWKAAIRKILPRVGQQPHRSGLARMYPFARADERHEAACRQRCADRRHRCRHRQDRDAGGSRGRDRESGRIRSCGKNHCRHQLRHGADAPRNRRNETGSTRPGRGARATKIRLILP
jgi:methionine synthase II (cobalamin-independent)